jgi:hypothetical protein
LKKLKLAPPDENLAAAFFVAASVEFESVGHYKGMAFCSSFVLWSYANVVLPLKPLVGPSMFGRGVAQPG